MTDDYHNLHQQGKSGKSWWPAIGWIGAIIIAFILICALNGKGPQ